MNLMVAEEGEAEDEQEGEKVYNDANHMPMILMRSKKMRKACH